MQGEHNPRLTSSELAVVWSSYQNNSFSLWMMEYFLVNVDDMDIKSVLQYARDISEQNLNFSKRLLIKDKQPIPVGFTENDVDLNAPRLYSDAFYLYYLKSMSKVGLSVYGVALATAAQSDVRDFLSQANHTSTELYNKTAKILLDKGLFIRPPYVATSKKVDFIDSKSYYGNPINLNNRPLNVIEITHIAANVEANSVGRALLTGFAQVAKSQAVKDYCTKGKEIAKKHVKIFSSFLIKDEISSPIPWDLEVTDSTIPPFSDKMIMFHTALIIATSISNYATGSAASLRMDIPVAYSRLTIENAKFAKSGSDIMIKHKWFEQPPQAPNHKELARE